MITATLANEVFRNLLDLGRKDLGKAFCAKRMGRKAKPNKASGRRKFDFLVINVANTTSPSLFLEVCSQAQHLRLYEFLNFQFDFLLLPQGLFMPVGNADKSRFPP